MASAITHFVVGAALALPAIESSVIRRVMPGSAILVSAGMLAVAPDFDTFIMQASGIPYDSFLGHRGFFHSPFFLLLFAASLAAIATRRHPRRATVKVAVMWAGCTITHPLLDALTDGGSGVMPLFPFSEARLFFSWRPIHVSPISMARFFDHKHGIIVHAHATNLQDQKGVVTAGVDVLVHTVANQKIDDEFVALLK
jgi:inner membrane protein